MKKKTVKKKPKYCRHCGASLESKEKVAGYDMYTGKPMILKYMECLNYEEFNVGKCISTGTAYYEPEIHTKIFIS